jgi:hypothetical protein
VDEDEGAHASHARDGDGGGNRSDVTAAATDAARITYDIRRAYPVSHP